MTPANKKEGAGEAFRKELFNHIELVKNEFDEVESVAINSFRMEQENKEIQALQLVKDAKMRLLRIRFHHEADLILKEFMDRSQVVLDRDRPNTSAGDSGKNRRSERTAKKKKDKDDSAGDRRKDSKKNSSGSTLQRAGRQGTTKRTKHHGESSRPGNTDHGKPVCSESSKPLQRNLRDDKVKSTSHSEEQSASQSPEIESGSWQEAQPVKLGKICILRNNDGKPSIVVKQDPDSDSVQKCDLVAQESDDRSVPEKENTAEEKTPDKNVETPQKPVRRSARARKKSVRLIENMDAGRSRK